MGTDGFAMGDFDELVKWIKDWGPLILSAAAVAISIWVASRTRWFQRRQLLTSQPDFSAEWHEVDDRRVTSLKVTNIGNAPGFGLSASLAADPHKLMGLTEDFSGPIQKDEYVLINSTIDPDRFQYGFPGPQVDVRRPDVILEWHDVYGQPHRKVFKHEAVPLVRSRGEATWQALATDPMVSKSGPKNSVRYEDKGVVPFVKPRFFAGRWVGRQEE